MHPAKSVIFFTTISGAGFGLIALLALDPEALADLARREGWPGDPAAWLEQPALQRLLQARVDAANQGLNSWETVKRWGLLPEPPSVENGQLTATLKKRRAAIGAARAEQIAAIYARAR